MKCLFYHPPAAIILPSLDESKQQTDAVNRVNTSINSAPGNVKTSSVWWSSPTYNTSPYNKKYKIKHTLINNLKKNGEHIILQ